MSAAPIALTREISGGFADCELTHLERRSIDLARARLQHRAYQERLAELGCRLHPLPADDALPDSVFVEDTAVVVDEIAVVARPGATSRRPETEAVAAELGRFRRLVRIEGPATLDGGDVLVAGRRVWVGLSRRTSRNGARQLARHLEPLGYRVATVPVTGCLHLKSAVTEVASGRLLVNPGWVEAQRFDGQETIAVDPHEPFAANALRIGERVVYPAAFPATRRRLEAAGIRIEPVDVSEIAKAEGGVTCCSLIFRR